MQLWNEFHFQPNYIICSLIAVMVEPWVDKSCNHGNRRWNHLDLEISLQFNRFVCYVTNQRRLIPSQCQYLITLNIHICTGDLVPWCQVHTVQYVDGEWVLTINILHCMNQTAQGRMVTWLSCDVMWPVSVLWTQSIILACPHTSTGEMGG